LITFSETIGGEAIDVTPDSVVELSAAALLSDIVDGVSVLALGVARLIGELAGELREAVVSESRVA
jgi:hypothetical protein